jgi:dUTP pyrophosphatase
MKTIEVKQLTPTNFNILPTRANPGDAGLDLYTPYDLVILAKGYTVANTGIAINIPYGYEGMVKGRSGLAFKQRIFCAHVGTIDHGYQGEIKVLLHNGCHFDVELKAGDRIAQLVINKIELPRPILIDGDFVYSVRGVNGFGSTGQ